MTLVFKKCPCILSCYFEVLKQSALNACQSSVSFIDGQYWHYLAYNFFLQNSKCRACSSRYNRKTAGAAISPCDKIESDYTYNRKSNNKLKCQEFEYEVCKTRSWLNEKSVLWSQKAYIWEMPEPKITSNKIQIIQQILTKCLRSISC
jgi:hypothetical protein